MRAVRGEAPTALPSRLLLEGSHLSVAVIVGDRARALALYTPGVGMHALGDRVLVRFPEPRRLRASVDAGGALVVAEGSVLTTLALSSAALCALDAPPGALIEARGGALVVHRLDAHTRVDPSRWLDVGALEVLQATPLGPEPDPAEPPMAKAAEDARAALGDAIPAAAEGAREAAAALRAALRGSDGTERGSGDHAHALPPKVGSWLTEILDGLRGLFGLAAFGAGALGEGEGRSARGVGSGTSDLARVPGGPSLLDRVRGWFARQLLRTRLSRHLGRHQAEYLARMLELIDRGDVREALRWAIPLGDAASEPAPLSLAAPAPRDSLALMMHRVPARSTIGGHDLHAHLHQRYLRMLADLQAKGMVDEAAFVLAELLGDALGAVALLERHGRFRQAALLAEARELPPAVQVRLYMLDRDVARALAIARRHDAYAESVALLRKDHPAAADALALEWADLLARCGDFSGAVYAAIPVTGSAGLIRDWLERAIEGGGVTGARMLAQRAIRCPERFDDTRARALELLEDPSAERAREREAFAQGLRSAPRAEGARALAPVALRALWRDRAFDTARSLESMVSATLRADRPPRPSRNAAPRLGEAGCRDALRFGAEDVGSMAVHDLAWLPSGRLLAALGEAGVRLIGRDGRGASLIDAPADALVVSDNGNRAIAVARRGEIQRLSRIDLQDRRAEPWWETRLNAFCRTFDGGRWLVSDGGVATLVDAIATDWRALWRLEEEACVALDRGDNEACLLTVDADRDLSRWLYTAGCARLRSRRSVGAALDDARALSMAGGADLWALADDTALEVAADRARLTALDGGREWPLAGRPLPGSLAVGSAGGAVGGFVACAATVVTEGVLVSVVASRGPTDVLLSVHLDGATRCGTRIQHGVLALGDDRGRALAIDLATGELLRDLRIRA